MTTSALVYEIGTFYEESREQEYTLITLLSRYIYSDIRQDGWV